MHVSHAPRPTTYVPLRVALRGPRWRAHAQNGRLAAAVVLVTCPTGMVFDARTAW